MTDATADATKTVALTAKCLPHTSIYLCTFDSFGAGELDQRNRRVLLDELTLVIAEAAPGRPLTIDGVAPTY